MSNAGLDWAYAQKLPSHEKFVLVTLANRANSDLIAWPSIASLVADCCMSERSIQRVIGALCDRGLIAADRFGGRSTTTRYALQIGATDGVKGAASGTHEAPERVPPMEIKGATHDVKGATDGVKGAASGTRTFLEPKEPSKRTQETRASTALVLTPPDQPLVNGKLAAFEEWWSAYPLKVGKGAARTAYAKALQKTDHGVLLAALNRPWGPRKFIPHPTTWLNQERWTDEHGGGHDPVLRALGLDADGHIQRDPIEEMTP